MSRLVRNTITQLWDIVLDEDEVFDVEPHSPAGYGMAVTRLVVTQEGAGPLSVQMFGYRRLKDGTLALAGVAGFGTSVSAAKPLDACHEQVRAIVAHLLGSPLAGSC